MASSTWSIERTVMSQCPAISWYNTAWPPEVSVAAAEFGITEEQLLERAWLVLERAYFMHECRVFHDVFRLGGVIDFRIVEHFGKLLHRPAFAAHRIQEHLRRGLLVRTNHRERLLERRDEGRVSLRIFFVEFCCRRYHRKWRGAAHHVICRHDGSDIRFPALALMKRRRRIVRRDLLVAG